MLCPPRRGLVTLLLPGDYTLPALLTQASILPLPAEHTPCLLIAYLLTPLVIPRLMMSPLTNHCLMNSLFADLSLCFLKSTPCLPPLAACKCNSLPTLYHDIAADWDYAKN